MIFCYNKFCIEIFKDVIFLYPKERFCYNKFCIEIYGQPYNTDFSFNFAITNFVLKYKIEPSGESDTLILL